MTTRSQPRRTTARAVLNRIVLALVGGYGFAMALARAVAAHWPGPRIEAAVAGTLLAYVGYAIAALFAFAPRRAANAWGAMAFATAGLLILSAAGPR